jgi:hypothetical protein
MSQTNNTQQNRSLSNKKSEDMLNFTLGLVIAIFSAWGIYIGISLHL